MLHGPAGAIEHSEVAKVGDEGEAEGGEGGFPGAAVEVVGEGELGEFVAAGHAGGEPMDPAAAGHEVAAVQAREAAAENDDGRPDVLRHFGGTHEPLPSRGNEDGSEDGERDESDEAVDENREEGDGAFTWGLLEEIENLDHIPARAAGDEEIKEHTN